MRIQQGSRATSASGGRRVRLLAGPPPRTRQVVQYELHALASEHYRVVAAMRRDTVDIIETIVRQGIRDGVFTVEHPDDGTGHLFPLRRRLPLVPEPDSLQIGRARHRLRGACPAHGDVTGQKPPPQVRRSRWGIEHAVTGGSCRYSRKYADQGVDPASVVDKLRDPGLMDKLRRRGSST